MRPHLLVVEDDAATRTLLTVVLTRAGFDVDSVAIATSALPLLRAARYSAVTLDLYGTSGHELLKAIGLVSPELLEHVVIVSAATQRELEALRSRWPGVRAMRKPFDINALVATVESAAADLPAIRPADAVDENRSSTETVLPPR